MFEVFIGIFGVVVTILLTVCASKLADIDSKLWQLKATANDIHTLLRDKDI